MNQQRKIIEKEAFQEVCVSKAKMALGVSKGKLKGIQKESWWWNDETQEAVTAKKKAYKEWTKCKMGTPVKVQLRRKYDELRKQARKVVASTQAAAKEKFYDDLETSNGAQKIFRIADHRRRDAKNIVAPKFILDAHGNLLTDNARICERWFVYMCQLLNEQFPRSVTPNEAPVNEVVKEITLEEVELAVKQMKKNKAVGPDEIPAEWWKVSGQNGANFLQIMFNKLLRGESLPRMFLLSFLLPFYKNKGDQRVRQLSWDQTDVPHLEDLRENNRCSIEKIGDAA